MIESVLSFLDRLVIGFTLIVGFVNTFLLMLVLIFLKQIKWELKNER